VAEAGPKLEVVPGGAGSDVPEGSEAPDRPEAFRHWTPWLLLGLLLLALIGLGVEARRADQLEARVTGLEADLGTAEAALTAHRQHLEAVRVSAAELIHLVNQDPDSSPRD
jgi:hypothetical protein|tara:strand:+ start:814 stop:1146 length:333 start_codon:yes stop_codon:yes gene_type:complete